MSWQEARPPRSLPYVGTRPTRRGHCPGLATGMTAPSLLWVATSPPASVTTIVWHQSRPAPSLPWVGTRAASAGHCLGFEPGAPAPVRALGWNQAQPTRSLPWVGTRPARQGHCPGLARGSPASVTASGWHLARPPRITALGKHQARLPWSLPWVGTRPARPGHCPDLAPGPPTLFNALGWHQARPP